MLYFSDRTRTSIFILTSAADFIYIPDMYIFCVYQFCFVTLSCIMYTTSVQESRNFCITLCDFALYILFDGLV